MEAFLLLLQILGNLLLEQGLRVREKLRILTLVGNIFKEKKKRDPLNANLISAKRLECSVLGHYGENSV